MNDHTLSAHTHGDHVQVDARTVARIVRYATLVLGVVLTILSLISLALGLAHERQEPFIVGCTVLVCAAFAGAISVGAYMLELVAQEQAEVRREMREIAEDHQEFRRRFASLEAGERAIADAVCSISDPHDELHDRRLGGRQN